MKKVVALLMVLAVFSATVFAAPVSIAGSLDASSREVLSAGLSVKTDNPDGFDDLFADVRATPLTDIEASETEGEGFWGGLLGGVAGGIAGALGLSFSFNFIQSNVPSATVISVKYSTIAGSVLGGIAGALAGARLGYTYLPF
jgi:hypothetical protein